MQRASHFYLKNDKMFKKHTDGCPLLVILKPKRRYQILKYAHEKLGHRGTYGVFYHLRDRFYWPRMFQDMKHRVSSCHECQIWSTKKVEVPPTIQIPVTIFTQIYADVMFMPKAGGYRYLVAARNDLLHAAEGRALKQLTSRNIAKYL